MNGNIPDPLEHAAGVLLDDIEVTGLAGDLRLAAQKLCRSTPALAERLEAWANAVEGVGEDSGFEADFFHACHEEASP